MKRRRGGWNGRKGPEGDGGDGGEGNRMDREGNRMDREGPTAPGDEEFLNGSAEGGV